MAATVAQLVEHILGKDEVMGSSPISSPNNLFCWFGHLAEHCISFFLDPQIYLKVQV